VVAVISEGRRLNCRHLVLADCHLPVAASTTAATASLCRGVLIVDRPLLPPPSSATPGVSLLRLPSPASPHTCTLLQLAPDTHCAAPGTWLVHLSCLGDNAEQILSPIVEKVINNLNNNNTSEQNAPSPILFSLYYNTAPRSNCKDSASPHSNMHPCSGPDDGLDYTDAIGEARAICGRICPGEEFMPRAPDPDEIIFDSPADDDSAAATGCADDSDNAVVSPDNADAVAASTD